MMIAFVFTISISSWIIPTVWTIFLFFLMFTGYDRGNVLDELFNIFRLLYLIPILIAWLIYFAAKSI